MVRQEKITKWICDVCNKEFISIAGAEACEKIHNEGFVKKMYVRGTYNVSEYEECFGLSESDAVKAKYGLSEVEVLVRFKEDSENAEIVGADGFYLDKKKPYKS